MFARGITKVSIGLCFSVFCACATSSPPQESRGVPAIVVLKNGDTVEGELIAVSSGSVYVSKDSVRWVEESRIHSIQVTVEVSRSWLYPVVGIGWLSTVAVLREKGITQTLGVIGLLVGGFAAYAYLDAEPRTSFSFPISDEDRSSLQILARHHYELTEKQLRQIRATTRP